jgi:uncharacterized small protein (TIGR04563 family)
MGRHHAEVRGRSFSVYLGETADEIHAEAARLDRTPSWVMMRAWKLARKEIRKMSAPPKEQV